ncbi:MAG: hypothetical protein JXR60_02250 [Bacteroidales bacterium]|nr:hypothetical protein [Bacteroidales bacterium]
MKIFLLSLSLFLTVSAWAQNVEFKKKNFNSESDFNAATEALEAGDDMFFVGNFEKALPKFLDAQKYNDQNALLNFKIGACYLKIDEVKKSMPYFKKAKELDPQVDPKIDFALAQSFQANEKFEEALSSYENYLNGLSKNKRPLEEDQVQKQIDICKTEIQKQKSLIEEQKEKEQIAVEPENAEVETETEVTTTTSEIAEVVPEEKKKTENLVVKEEQKVVESPIKEEKPQPKTEVKTTSAVPAASSNASGSKITYRIQITSTSQPASNEEIKKIYDGPLKLTHEKVGSVYKYFIGDFDSKAEAMKAKSLSGISDAFIVKFIDGKKM